MKRLVVGLLGFAVVTATTAHGAAPRSIEVTCDIDGTAFRSAAQNQSQLIFEFWDAESGGSRCGPAYPIVMSDLLMLKEKSDRFDGQKSRRFASIFAVLGSDASPVQLCAAETWMDLTVGLRTLTCDFSSNPPKARQRLQGVPCGGGPGPAGDHKARLDRQVSRVLGDPLARPVLRGHRD